MISTTLDLDDLLSRFAVALGIGLLIGLERGWRTREDRPGSRTAGLRTFSLTALLGALAAALAGAVGGAASAGGGLLLGIAFAAFAGVFATFCRDENRSENTFSATTMVAGLLTFALGAYALAGDLHAAGAIAVAATLLLAGRENLHGWVEQITWPELRSGLVLLAMTFIALPLVPNENFGPFGGVNPREVWLIAIVLAGVSFVGYVAVKALGARHGLLIAAAAGGLVSSTAVTVSNARRAAAGEGSAVLLAAGVALATAISFGRVLAIAAALRPSLLTLLAPPLAAAALTAAACAALAVYGRAGDAPAGEAGPFRNPFSFWSVVGFALMLALVIVAGRLVGEHLGGAGAVVGAAAMGLADVDAITVAMARLVPEPLSPASATYAILAAVASNTLSKLAIGAGIGRGRFSVEITVMSALCALAGGAALWAALMFAD
jgi:uncharacterized membrane protein (DUF4010 family)